LAERLDAVCLRVIVTDPQVQYADQVGMLIRSQKPTGSEPPVPVNLGQEQ
jgi:hypothetical protein